MKICSSTKVLSRMRLSESLRLIHDSGYDGAEIWAAQIWNDDLDSGNLRRLIRELDLYVSLHAPIVDLNITSADADIREISLQKTIRSLELAAELDVEHVTVHPGRKSSSKESEEAIRTRQIESVGRLVEIGRTLGVRICIENMENRSLEVLIHPESLRQLRVDINSDSLGITFDIAHASTIPNMDPRDYIRDLGTFHQVHVSDSSPEKTHLPLGEGRLDLPAILSVLDSQYDGYIAIEGYVADQELKVLQSNLAFIKEWAGNKEVKRVTRNTSRFTQ